MEKAFKNNLINSSYIQFVASYILISVFQQAFLYVVISQFVKVIKHFLKLKTHSLQNLN